MARSFKARLTTKSIRNFRHTPLYLVLCSAGNLTQGLVLATEPHPQSNIAEFHLVKCWESFRPVSCSSHVTGNFLGEGGLKTPTNHLLESFYLPPETALRCIQEDTQKGESLKPGCNREKTETIASEQTATYTTSREERGRKSNRMSNVNIQRLRKP